MTTCLCSAGTRWRPLGWPGGSAVVWASRCRCAGSSRPHRLHSSPPGWPRRCAATPLMRCPRLLCACRARPTARSVRRPRRPRSGSGFSNSWSPGPAPTTSRRSSIFTGRSTSTRSRPRSGRWWPGTRRFERRSRHMMVGRCSRSTRLRPAESWPLVVEDLQKVGPGERETLVAARARTDAGQRFDLEAGPLLRTHLLRLSPDEHRLVICAHHIVVDGWSVGVLLQELGTLYAATASGAHWQDALPPPALQYADCTAWQRQSLTTERVDQLLGYWRCELGADSQGVPIQPLAIPTERARRTGRPTGRARSPLHCPTISRSVSVTSAAPRA